MKSIKEISTRSRPAVDFNPIRMQQAGYKTAVVLPPDQNFKDPLVTREASI